MIIEFIGGGFVGAYLVLVFVAIIHYNKKHKEYRDSLDDKQYRKYMEFRKQS